ncbi:MAG: hypothetical protein Q7S22_05770 [Candidatus Micrarchaeota archaeon]|nr:hypothetical protein [Candidatus Micrarchaeota archaeon]
MKISEKWSLFIGVFAMILLVAGTLSESGSLLQKFLFLIGAPILGITAYVDKQKMFTTLQVIASLGALIAFFPNLSDAVRYGLMIGGTAIALFYLIKIKYFKEDNWGWLGSVGLICIAFGFATNANLSPLWFGLFLGAGGLLVAAYSTISLFHYKIKIALIWLILNIIFSINPILIFLTSWKL